LKAIKMNLKNSLYKVDPSPFDKEIVLPTSKSHANRALIIGALRGNGFRIHQLPNSTDVTTLLACLKTAGLKISQQNNSVVFHNSFPACEKETEGSVIDLKTGDGGTTNRFLLALLARGEKCYRFFPTEKMSERPMDDLLGPLKKLQVEILSQVDGAWLSLQGPAKILGHSSIEIDCKNSTQFASAMMLAFANEALNFDLKNVHASETYLKMTRSLLKETGQKNDYTVPVDFSCLGYPLALALVMNKARVLIKNCKQVDPLQADSQLIKLMQDCGADISWSSAGLLATSKNKLKPFEVDGAQFPDLIPTLSFIASHLAGKSIIRNLSILRHKESDRLEQILMLLKMFSIPFYFDETRDEISIEGREDPSPAMTINPARDHRMVMTSYLFLRANQGGMLSEVDCVEKSFPGFFEII